jgi:hypothetical protein
MSKKELRDKKAEQRADRTVKILFLSLVVLGLILMIWFSLSNA